MKKHIAVAAALAAVCLAAMSFVFTGARADSAQAAETNYIDMYLIGGQSNAAGYSSYGDVTKQTFGHILYAGETDRQIGTTTTTSNYIRNFSSAVRVGLGAGGTFIGPEYGMAGVLNGLYAPDNKAIIFKSAAGGTSLLNTNTDNSALFGNWLPPSERDNYPENTATGVQYDVFMENFTAVYNKLVSQGYTPRVRGMAWMQGEQDRHARSQYRTVIQSFIADVRSDLSEITGTDLSQMPFVMGEISRTFNAYGDRPVNMAFNAMLHEIPDLVPVTSVIESGQFDVNDATGTVGTDIYHWNGPDMEQVGRMFAEAILAWNEPPEDAEPVTPPDDTPTDSGDGERESGGCGCGGALAGSLALSAAALAVFVRKP